MRRRLRWPVLPVDPASQPLPWVVLSKLIGSRRLYWNGHEWHPDRSQAVEYPRFTGQQELCNIVTKEQYAIEDA